ncbi:MAG: class I SAM-dependent methyltransferase [Sandaracinaceae bacterium]|nr:class I SAM-dependent methyltransferase [Sandaracinaceae bacterium]
MTQSPHDMPGELYDATSAAIGNHAHEILFGLAYAHLHPGERVLDVGIGSGLAAELFHRAGLVVEGLDVSDGMLETCRGKHVAERLVVHDVGVRPWPFADASFDHVVACGLLHFFRDLDPLLDEMARVVRPGGLVAFTEMERAPEAPTPMPVFVRSFGIVLSTCRTHGLEVFKDVGFTTPSGPSGADRVGFHGYLARRAAHG